MKGLQRTDDRAAAIARPSTMSVVAAPVAGAGLAGVILPRTVASTVPVVVVAVAVAGWAILSQTARSNHNGTGEHFVSKSRPSVISATHRCSPPWRELSNR